MGLSAITMLVTTLTLLLPMFHTVDTDLRGGIENGPAIKTILSEKRKSGTEMHHGVHKNVQDHIQGLKDHIIKEKMAKRQTQLDIERRKEKLHQNVIAVNIQQPVEMNTFNSESKDANIPSEKIEKIELIKPPLVSDKSTSLAHNKNKTQLFFLNENEKLARGLSGLPIEKTPALVGAKRASIDCDVNVK